MEQVMVTISDNTIYYTLSTISQTMAALFAVVGTFVIFQIQTTEARLSGLLTGKAKSETRNDAYLRVSKLIVSKRYREANESFGIKDDGLIASDIDLLDRYKNLIRTTTISSSVTILLSIFLLSFVDQIKGSLIFGIGYWLTTTLFIGSLTTLAWKVLLIFK